jgi:hypothetical protein
MPTARELLEQADALMRRNRGGDSGIPLLTDAIPEESAMPSRTGPSTRERTGPTSRDQIADARAPRDRALRDDGNQPPESSGINDATGAEVPQEGGEQAGPTTVAPAPDIDVLASIDDAEGDLEPPLLTDVVEEVAIDLAPLPPEMAEDDPSLWLGPEDDPSPWLGPDTMDPALHSITGPAPDTVAVVPPFAFRAVEPQAETAQQAEERDPTVTRTLRAAGSAPTPPPTGSTPPGSTESPAASTGESVPAEATNDDERWRALAEQISMQVLQRLDLFIDTGLKAQLASHLQPIVARAGAELVEAIDAHVGQLVRTYVAEAIEREIAQWRQQQKK